MIKRNEFRMVEELYQWRVGVLRVFVITAAIAAGIGTVASIIEVVSSPKQWMPVILYAVLELALVLLALFPRADHRIRAWGVLLVPYMVGVTELASYGLGSSGRIYMLALPIGALVLIGVRSALLMSGLTALTMAGFTLLAQQGISSLWLIKERSSLLFDDWLAVSIDYVMLLTLIMSLLILFYRLLERLMETERRVQAELKAAHELLEAQNATLEQKVGDRTQELRQSNTDLEQRNTELTILNNLSQAMTQTLDVRSMARIVGDNLCDIFDADAVSIMLYDEQSGQVQSFYEFDKKEGGHVGYLEPFPLGKGLVSKVIATRQPLLLKTIGDEIANGADFPQELLEHGRGSIHQSWLGVPILVNDRALGVVSLSDYRPQAFDENHQRLMQTLCSNIGVALENRRLLDISQESQRRMAAIIDFLPDATFVIDRDGRVLAWNHAIEEMTGVKAYEILGKGDYEYALPFYGERRPILIDLAGKSQEEIQQNYSKIERQGSTLAAETYVPRLRGSPHYLQATASTLTDASGQMEAAIETIRDITDHKHAEMELRESDEKLRLIFESAFDGISIYEDIPNQDRRILLECNERYCQLAGRTKEELLAVHDTRSIQVDLGSGEERFGWEPISAGKAFAGVFAWVRPDGKENIIEYNASSTIVDGRFFTIGIDRDATERRRAQRELRQAKEMAEAATVAKSAFLANMSHELRTPLNSIIGFTRIVRRKAEGVLAEKQTENLEKVLASAEHLLNLINTVLDIAKIEAGRMDVLAANFRVSTLIDLCVNTSQALFRPGVIFEKQVDERLTLVYSDQDKIRQIVLNLLSNAAKFTHAGSVRLLAYPEGDDQLCIAVADTGIGIGPDALPRIFKEFQQADSSTTRQYGGTGLGLSISRNLARLLGGEITVESELGKGSTFTLHLPLSYKARALAAPDTPDTTSAHEPVHLQSSNTAQKHVLVIDDDPDAVYLLRENLNQKEFDITGTRSGREGLALARSTHPQAILLDIVMPEADGWQILHELKADPATAHIPVILLTIVDKKALGFRLGAAAYLLKPLDPAAVRDALNQVVGTEHARQKRVLVVDDDPSVADMLRQYLPESEFALDAAPDGLAGLEAIAAACPDVLLLDLVMPRLDGFGVIERLRADPKLRDLPIIVISAKDLTAEETARLKESADLVMKKQGFQGEQLASEIESVLKNEWRLP